MLPTWLCFSTSVWFLPIFDTKNQANQVFSADDLHLPRFTKAPRMRWVYAWVGYPRFFTSFGCLVMMDCCHSGWMQWPGQWSFSFTVKRQWSCYLVHFGWKIINPPSHPDKKKCLETCKPEMNLGECRADGDISIIELWQESLAHVHLQWSEWCYMVKPRLAS